MQNLNKKYGSIPFRLNGTNRLVFVNENPSDSAIENERFQEMAESMTVSAEADLIKDCYWFSINQIDITHLNVDGVAGNAKTKTADLKKVSIDFKALLNERISDVLKVAIKTKKPSISEAKLEKEIKKFMQALEESSLTNLNEYKTAVNNRLNDLTLTATEINSLVEEEFLHFLMFNLMNVDTVWSTGFGGVLNTYQDALNKALLPRELAWPLSPEKRILLAQLQKLEQASTTTPKDTGVKEILKKLWPKTKDQINDAKENTEEAEKMLKDLKKMDFEKYNGQIEGLNKKIKEKTDEIEAINKSINASPPPDSKAIAEFRRTKLENEKEKERFEKQRDAFVEPMQDFVKEYNKFMGSSCTTWKIKFKDGFVAEEDSKFKAPPAPPALSDLPKRDEIVKNLKKKKDDFEEEQKSGRGHTLKSLLIGLKKEDFEKFKPLLSGDQRDAVAKFSAEFAIRRHQALTANNGRLADDLYQERLGFHQKFFNGVKDRASDALEDGIHTARKKVKDLFWKLIP